MKILPKSEAEWLELRKHAVNSTESSALFNMCPYQTLFELWHHKKGDLIEEPLNKDILEAGKRLEPVIAQWVADREGLIIEEFNEYITSDNEPRMGSSFDYKIVDVCPWSVHAKTFSEKGIGILEVKNVSEFAYKGIWENDEAPRHIEVQVQHQMEVADINWCLIGHLVGGNTPKIIYRERDLDIGKALVNKVRWLYKSIEENSEPLPDFLKDTDAINSLFKTGIEILDASSNATIMELGNALLKAQNEKKILEDIETECKNKLKFLAVDYGKIMFDDFTISKYSTADTPDKVITTEMVGEIIKGRKGSTIIKVNRKKE